MTGHPGRNKNILTHRFTPILTRIGALVNTLCFLVYIRDGYKYICREIYNEWETARYPESHGFTE